MATLARDVMTPHPECIEEGRTIAEAAKRLAKYDVGALPVCDDVGKVTGMLTDRDIVLKVVAAGRDPNKTRVGELTAGNPVSLKPDASLDDVLQAMIEYKVRRLPVIENRELIGIISQADLALNLPHEKSGELLEAISVP